MSVKYTSHRFADELPSMSDAEFEALKTDIEKNGLREPICLFEGKILDGRNRYRACLKAGRKPRFRRLDMSRKEARAFTVSENLQRRHLTKSQQAMYIVQAGLLGKGGRPGRKRRYRTGDSSIRRIGERYGVSHVSIYKAMFVHQNDQDNLAARVLKGELSVAKAERIIRDSLGQKVVRRKKRAKPKKKECLVISAIGKKGSLERQHANMVLKDVISPALIPLGYNVYRTDGTPFGTRIDEELVTKLMEAELVVADVSYLNPNLLWALGVRHAWNRPVIQIALSGTDLPFDIQDMQTVFCDTPKLAANRKAAQSSIRKAIRAVERGQGGIPLFRDSFAKLAMPLCDEAQCQAVLSGMHDALTDFQRAVHAVRREIPRGANPPGLGTLELLCSLLEKPVERLECQWYVLSKLVTEFHIGELPDIMRDGERLVDEGVRLGKYMAQAKPTKSTLPKMAAQLSRLMTQAKTIAKLALREQRP